MFTIFIEQRQGINESKLGGHFFPAKQKSILDHLFDGLMHFGAYDPNVPKNVDCLRFCFMHVIQNDLDDIRRAWNAHRIRPSRDACCLAGLQDELL